MRQSFLARDDFYMNPLRHKEGFTVMVYKPANALFEHEWEPEEAGRLINEAEPVTIWNSRDGITPFRAQIKEIDPSIIYQNQVGQERFEPFYVPEEGEFIWESMTLDDCFQSARSWMQDGRTQDPEGFDDYLHRYHKGSAKDMLSTKAWAIYLAYWPHSPKLVRATAEHVDYYTRRGAGLREHQQHFEMARAYRKQHGPRAEKGFLDKVTELSPEERDKKIAVLNKALEEYRANPVKAAQNAARRAQERKKLKEDPPQ